MSLQGPGPTESPQGAPRAPPGTPQDSLLQEMQSKNNGFSYFSKRAWHQRRVPGRSLGVPGRSLRSPRYTQGPPMDPEGRPRDSLAMPRYAQGPPGTTKDPLRDPQAAGCPWIPLGTPQDLPGTPERPQGPHRNDSGLPETPPDSLRPPENPPDHPQRSRSLLSQPLLSTNSRTAQQPAASAINQWPAASSQRTATNIQRPAASKGQRTSEAVSAALVTRQHWNSPGDLHRVFSALSMAQRKARTD